MLKTVGLPLTAASASTSESWQTLCPGESSVVGAWWDRFVDANHWVDRPETEWSTCVRATTLRASVSPLASKGWDQWPLQGRSGSGRIAGRVQRRAGLRIQQKVKSPHAERCTSRRPRGRRPKRAPATGHTEPACVRRIDGAWWPRSTQLAAELPAVLSSSSDRLGQVVGVGYRRDGWTDTPPTTFTSPTNQSN